MDVLVTVLLAVCCVATTIEVSELAEVTQKRQLSNVT